MRIETLSGNMKIETTGSKLRVIFRTGEIADLDNAHTVLIFGGDHDNDSTDQTGSDGRISEPDMGGESS